MAEGRMRAMMGFRDGMIFCFSFGYSIYNLEPSDLWMGVTLSTGICVFFVWSNIHHHLGTNIVLSYSDVVNGFI